MTRSSKSGGFTLIELMIVVGIIAVLATVAGMAYIRHIKSARVVSARQFISQIHARQAAYLQEHGYYCDASGAASTPMFLPGLKTGEEPVSKAWDPAGWSSNGTGWLDLGARPEDDRTYAAVYVRASDPDDASGEHARYELATDAAMGIPAQPTADDSTKHPWFFVVAHMDLNADATYTNGGCSTPSTGLSPTNCTVVWSSNVNAKVMIKNEGE